MTLKQLSGIDGTFLYLETSTSMTHINSLSIYTPPGDDPTFDPHTAFRAQIMERLPLLAPFRRRLVTVPFDLDHPYWINDPDFDLDFHLRHIAVPSPGRDEELADLVAMLVSTPLDRARPLWQSYVIEGLATGDFAIMTKIHHSAMDGAAGAELTSLLLDHERNPPRRIQVHDDWEPDELPSSIDMLAKTGKEMLLQPQKAARLQLRAIRLAAKRTRSGGLEAMTDRARHVLGLVDADEELPEATGVLAPETPFNKAISGQRTFAYRSVPLDDIRALKNALGVTVNDVVMAICAGALRRYLLDHDALPDRPLIAMVPVSIRTGDEVDKWTNRVSSIFPTLPTNLDEPVARVRAAADAMNEAKEGFDLVPAELIIDATRFAPPALAIRAARLATRMKLADRVNAPVNLVISNVPGPQTPLFCRGAELKHYYPISAIVEGQGLNITVQSYAGRMDFGLVACRTLVPDLWTLVDYCVDEVAALQQATR